MRDELLLIQGSFRIHPHRHNPAAMTVHQLMMCKCVHTSLIRPGAQSTLQSGSCRMLDVERILQCVCVSEPGVELLAAADLCRA